MSLPWGSQEHAALAGRASLWRFLESNEHMGSSRSGRVGYGGIDMSLNRAQSRGRVQSFRTKLGHLRYRLRGEGNR